MALRPPTARDAMSLFDPAFSSDHSADLVRVVLDQARRVPVFDDEVEGPTEAERRHLEVHHRIGPLVGRRFPASKSGELERRLMVGQLHLTKVLREISGVLAANDIDSRVLKGLATSELDYVTPSLRHTGDVDLLVRARELDQAVELLIDSGLTPLDEVAALEGRLSTGHNLKGVVLTHASGCEVDLHYRLSRFAPPPAAEVLMADPADMLFGLQALPAEGRLVHAAAHAVLSPHSSRRLSSLADVVAILDNTPFDWDAARRLADALGFAEACGLSFRAEAAIMQRPEHPGLAWPAPGPMLRTLILSPTRRPLLEHGLAMMALPAGMTRRSYVKYRLRPSADRSSDRGGFINAFKGFVARSTKPKQPSQDAGS